MKILGWIQESLRQRGIEQFKCINLGNYCTCLSAQQQDEEEPFSKPNLGSKYHQTLSQKPTQQYEDNTFALTCSAKDDHEQEALIELFDGFLAIGTLGIEAGISEPVTPTFAQFSSNTDNEVTEKTSDDLDFINIELEKFFEAESQEEDSLASSRTSYVSSITLSSNHMVTAEGDKNKNAAIFPLQEYLFGCSMELPETKIEMKKKRTSLAQLFEETKTMEPNIMGKSQRTDVHEEPIHKPSKHNLKKILKLISAFPSRLNSSAGSTGAASTLSAKKKFRKVLKMFHRKIHPEDSLATNKLDKSEGYNLKKNNTDDFPHMKQDLGKGARAKKDFSEGLKSLQQTGSMSTHQIVAISPHIKTEQWIKTDANYLVLEL